MDTDARRKTRPAPALLQRTIWLARIRGAFSGFKSVFICVHPWLKMIWFGWKLFQFRPEIYKRNLRARARFALHLKAAADFVHALPHVAQAIGGRIVGRP